MADRSRILKVAGFSLVGFCAVSAMADKLPALSNLSQMAGFCGAFTGALVGRYRTKSRASESALEDPADSAVISPAAPQKPLTD